MSKKYLVAVVGPTALGKSRLAAKLANHFDTAVISADSRQFYNELSIGTAVPGAQELGAAPHYFIQHISILDPYTVGNFERDALECLRQLYKQKDVVVLAGGSGLYIKAITEGLDTFPHVLPGLRKKLNERYEKEGIGILQDQLRELDLTYYSKVDLQNPQRIIRALEVCISSGRPYSDFLTGSKQHRPFKLLTLGLDAPREIIYQHIDQRVDDMMAKGLLEEARAVFEHRGLNALQTVGYKELFGYLEGRFSLEAAVDEIKKNTRRYAKRQLTWFRKQENVYWINYRQEFNETIKQLRELIDEREAENQ
jgi:tRNA dimethylallyltransferase